MPKCVSLPVHRRLTHKKRMRSMKKYRLLTAAFAACMVLAAVAPAEAQEAKKLFVDMPDSISPLLTKVNREDCIDFLESHMRARVTNRFGKTSEMTELGEDYIRMQLTSQSTWQMKVLSVNDSTRLICTVSTVCAPACDSDVRFYTTDWKPLPEERFIELPAMDDFITPPDSLKDDLYDYNRARLAADMTLLKADLDVKEPTLTFTLTTPDYMEKETAEMLQPYLRRNLVYRWKEGRFTSTPQ